jgi:hypothetical protein
MNAASPLGGAAFCSSDVGGLLVLRAYNMKRVISMVGMRRTPYPERVIPRKGFEARVSERTMTRLYNERPAWLDNVHRALDAAVASAYGWKDYTFSMPDEEIIRRLAAMNAQLATAHD